MDELTSATVERLLAESQQGDRRALAALFPIVYDELHAVARRQRGRWDGDFTLGTTALVHETYLKLVVQERVSATGRAHFLAIASRAMRHVLCNYAREQQRLKRGGGLVRVELEDVNPAAVAIVPDERAESLALLDNALIRLAVLHRRQHDVVECRFFGGLSVEDTAAALGISIATVKRDWTMARAWLFRELHGETIAGMSDLPS